MSAEFLPATGAARASLVLLHGWGCNREVWRPLVAQVRDWADVTLVDIPGAAPEMVAQEPPHLEAALQAVLAQCPPSAVYVGWSLGGMLAIEIARRWPERVSGVATLCSNPHFIADDDWPGMQPAAFDLFHRVVAADPALALKRFDLMQTQGSARTRSLAAQLRQQRRAQGSVALMAGLAWLRDLDARDALAALPQPQLHLLAAEDALVPPELAGALGAVLDGAGNARVELLSDVSHIAPLEAPAQIAAHLSAFAGVCGAASDAFASAAPAIAKRDVAASFSRAAAEYDSVAGLQRDVGAQLLSRLDDYAGQPRVILDLGSGTGFFARGLRERFARAQYIGLDIAEGMARHAREHAASADAHWLVADAEALPLAAESVDLVYSSLAFQWCERPRHLFAELSRVLRPGGCCVFTSLGPATLGELREAWAAVDAHQHVNSFLPATALRAAADLPGLDLTLDTRAFCMHYERVRELLDELKTLGAHNMNRQRAHGLTGRRALQGMLQAYEARRENGLLPATYEVQFGVLRKA